MLSVSAPLRRPPLIQAPPPHQHPHTTPQLTALHWLRVSSINFGKILPHPQSPPTKAIKPFGAKKFGWANRGHVIGQHCTAAGRGEDQQNQRIRSQRNYCQLFAIFLRRNFAWKRSWKLTNLTKKTFIAYGFWVTSFLCVCFILLLQWQKSMAKRQISHGRQCA